MFHTFHTFINYILTLITAFKSYVRYEHMLLMAWILSVCKRAAATGCWRPCAGQALALSCSFCTLLCPSGPRKGDRMPKSLIL